jgi:hypothetical protein
MAPVAGSIFFFFFVHWKSHQRWVVGGGWRRPFAEGGQWVFYLVDLLIGCFDFILNLCIFLKMLRCQLMNGGQKTPHFCHDHVAAALFNTITNDLIILGITSLRSVRKEGVGGGGGGGLPPNHKLTSHIKEKKKKKKPHKTILHPKTLNFFLFLLLSHFFLLANLSHSSSSFFLSFNREREMV